MPIHIPPVDSTRFQPSGDIPSITYQHGCCSKLSDSPAKVDPAAALKSTGLPEEAKSASFLNQASALAGIKL